MDQKKDAAAQAEGFIRLMMTLVGCGFVYKLWEKTVSFYHAHAARFHIVGYAFAFAAIALGIVSLINIWLRRKINPSTEVLVLGNSVSTGEPVYFSDEDRMLHMQVIGATRSGKTYYIVSKVISRDIEHGNGCLVIDGKSDASFLEAFEASADRSGRKDVVKLLLADAKKSGTYNPFFWGTPEQSTERFFSSFPFENPFYKAVQFNTLLAVLIAIRSQGKIPTPKIIYAHIGTDESMKNFAESLSEGEIKERIKATYKEPKKYQEYHAGLISYISQLCMGDVARIFDSATPTVNLEKLFHDRSVLYIQLPTLQYQTIAPAVGRMILLEMMQVISVAQVAKKVPEKILSIVLDDFNDFLFEGFGSLLNKSASAKIGVLFSHQSMGDLDRVGPAFKNVVTTNTNQKIFLRTPDPETAETLARTLGTKTAIKHTSRVVKSLLGSQQTGDLSERAVEEFLFHPNVLKSELVAGEGIVLKTTKTGTEINRVKFSKHLS